MALSEYQINTNPVARLKADVQQIKQNQLSDFADRADGDVSSDIRKLSKKLEILQNQNLEIIAAINSLTKAVAKIAIPHDVKAMPAPPKPSLDIRIPFTYKRKQEDER